MSRNPDSGKIDFTEVFRRVQTEMVAHLSVAGLFEHGVTQGSATEQDWMRLFELYLPRRYRVAPAFVVNADGFRSRQVDLAIFDNHSSPLIFPHQSGLHIPIESVYATFEVKSILTSTSLHDAGFKAASVRALRPAKSRPILAGILATICRWRPAMFSPTLLHNLEGRRPGHEIDLGCILNRVSFEYKRGLVVSEADEALFFLLLRLVHRLDSLGPAPRVNLMRYARSVKSFSKRRD